MSTTSARATLPGTSVANSVIHVTAFSDLLVMDVPPKMMSLPLLYSTGDFIPSEIFPRGAPLNEVGRQHAGTRHGFATRLFLVRLRRAGRPRPVELRML